jgi:hypothetical protein
VKDGQYYPEDEEWMVELTGGANPMLVWTNMPDDVKATTEKPTNKVMLSDTFGYHPKEDVTRHIFARTDSQIQAELALAKLEEQRELANRPVVEHEPSELEKLMEEYEELAEMYLHAQLELDSKDERLAILEAEVEENEFATEEEILVTPEVEEVESEVVKEDAVVVSDNLLKLKEALAEAPSVDRFIRDMKPEFRVEDLTEVAEELGMEYEGKKADMLRKFAEKLAE